MTVRIQNGWSQIVLLKRLWFINCDLKENLLIDNFEKDKTPPDSEATKKIIFHQNNIHIHKSTLTMVLIE